MQPSSFRNGIQRGPPRARSSSRVFPHSTRLAVLSDRTGRISGQRQGNQLGGILNATSSEGAAQREMSNLLRAGSDRGDARGWYLRMDGMRRTLLLGLLAGMLPGTIVCQQLQRHSACVPSL